MKNYTFLLRPTTIIKSYFNMYVCANHFLGILYEVKTACLGTPPPHTHTHAQNKIKWLLCRYKCIYLFFLITAYMPVLMTT
jgi:hypothetical protein